MKKVLAGMALATAMATSCVPAQAKAPETAQNVCNSDIAVNNAKNRVFALVQGFETGKNRLTVCNNGEILMSTKISTGKRQMKMKRDGSGKEMRGSYTPEGNFRITQRVEHGKTSNLYLGKNKKPAELPYWQRITNDGIGFHQGDVSQGPTASAGCIRLPGKYAQQFYNIVGKFGAKNVEIIIQGTNPKTKNDGK